VRISGFTFVRSAVRLDYPVVESIRSILPIVDEMVVNVGNSDDGTRELIAGIGDRRIRIVDSVWNPNVRSGGYVLAQQTNVALLNCTGDWAIYLQADEAIHERDHARLVELMSTYRQDERVEGLALRRLSFYGDYATVFDAHPMHLDLACRIVKPHKFVLSRGDAAGFTVHPKYKERGRRIRVVDSGLDVFHYMDVRDPAASSAFVREKSCFWSFEPPPEAQSMTLQYTRVPLAFLSRYTGSHPAGMGERIARHDFRLDMGRSDWRTKLTRREKGIYLRTLLIDILGLIVASGRSSRRIVSSHRVRGSDSSLERIVADPLGVLLS
jgi:hypothetical protein